MDVEDCTPVKHKKRKKVITLAQYNKRKQQKGEAK